MKEGVCKPRLRGGEGGRWLDCPGAQGVAPLIVPITMNAILSGEDITNAMDLRCFGIMPRIWVETLQFHWYDWVLIGLGVLMLAGALVLTNVYDIGGFWMPGM